MKPDIDLIKRQIEAQMADCERAAAEALAWLREWKARQQARAAEAAE